MVIENFEHFIGQHCETTATGSLLYQLGINFSEPMLFGLGEGLGYIIWKMKTMPFPFIGGRIKPDALTENMCRNLNLTLKVDETASVKKAWHNVKTHLDAGKAVGLKLDCYHLEYFTTKIHFAGHYTSIYGYDEQTAFLNDTYQQGRDTKTSLKSLALARNEKGPMASKNRSYTIHKNGEIPPLKKVITSAIYNNAITFLNPPIKNFGYKGINKTSNEIKKWFHSSKNIKKEFKASALLMERGGTGGSLFRNLYRDFLKESAVLLQYDALFKASERYGQIAQLWKNVAELFEKTSKTEEVEYVLQASEILLELSILERDTMGSLKETFSH